ncbi:MAG: hypothetical protein JSS66_03735 [Armatimonadetes bacterium]|nr:hypothetical protein [Armatimonadota bacterium]
MKTVALMVLAVPAAISYGQVSVTAFPGWGQTNALLGLNGHLIEDFEDPIFVGANSIEVQTANGSATYNSLPNLFDPRADHNGTAFLNGGGGNWDGHNGLINTVTNQTFPYGSFGDWGDITFHFSNVGATSVGLSVQQMDQDIHLAVNGVPLGGLSQFGFIPDGGRQGYIRIDAAPTLITSVTLSNGRANGVSDGFMLDHLYVKSAFLYATYDPTSITVNAGRVVSGDLASLADFDDGDALVVTRFITPNRSAPIVDIEVEGTGSSSYTLFGVFRIKSRMLSSGVFRQVQELWDPLTNTYKVARSDSLDTEGRSTKITGAKARNTHARARVRIYQDGPTTGPTPSVAIDFVGWVFGHNP